MEENLTLGRRWDSVLQGSFQVSVSVTLLTMQMVLAHNEWVVKTEPRLEWLNVSKNGGRERVNLNLVHS